MIRIASLNTIYLGLQITGIINKSALILASFVTMLALTLMLLSPCFGIVHKLLLI